MTITLPGDGGVATEPEPPSAPESEPASEPEPEPASGCECECEAAELLGLGMACVSAIFTGWGGEGSWERETDLMVSLTRFLRVVEAVVEATVMAMASCASGVGLFAGSALILMLFGLGRQGVSCTDLLFRAAALRCWRCGCCCGCGCGAVVTETEAVVDCD